MSANLVEGHTDVLTPCTMRLLLILRQLRMEEVFN